MARDNSILILILCVCSVRAARESYTAAVYEHAPYLLDPKVVVTKEEARANMYRNLDVYEDQIILAKQKGAEIIIFPEDGLYGFGFKTRPTIEPYLEDIPNPVDKPCPCSNPETNSIIPVQYRLSCLAKENAIYVVANAGDRKPCAGDKKCPPDGRFQYNTNVAYDPNGCLVARYYKQNLYREPHFDQPSKVEFSFFDTPFGRFGLAICFDILFKEPIVDLVVKYKATDIAFPTAWMDSLPLLSGIGYHSSWARGMGVNLLAANLHGPQYRMAGSGIYGPNGVLEFTRNDQKGGVLLVSNVPSVLSPPGKPVTRSKPLKPTETTGDVFQSVISHATFNFVYLEPGDKCSVVCQGSVCCSATYKASGGKNEYAIGAFDRLHTSEGKYYLQICVILKCAGASKDSCGRPVTSASWRFAELHLSGTFQTPYVFPQVITDGVRVPSKESWNFNDDQSISFRSVSDPLLSATLFVGRWNEKDSLDVQAKDSL